MTTELRRVIRRIRSGDGRSKPTTPGTRPHIYWSGGNYLVGSRGIKYLKEDNNICAPCLIDLDRSHKDIYFFYRF